MSNLIEREPVILYGYGNESSPDYLRLVHRTFDVPPPSALPEARLIACTRRWAPGRTYKVVDTIPTCVRCIAAGKP